MNVLAPFGAPTSGPREVRHSAEHQSVLASFPAPLVRRLDPDPASPGPSASRRTKIWEFSPHLMLSHLVGAANRTDIRRLSALEAEKAELESKLNRQQTQLREVVVSRDAQIRQLRKALASRIVAEEPYLGHAAATEATMLRQLVSAFVSWSPLSSVGSAGRPANVTSRCARRGSAPFLAALRRLNLSEEAD